MTGAAECVGRHLRPRQPIPPHHIVAIGDGMSQKVPGAAQLVVRVGADRYLQAIVVCRHRLRIVERFRIAESLALSALWRSGHVACRSSCLAVRFQQRRSLAAPWCSDREWWRRCRDIANDLRGGDFPKHCPQPGLWLQRREQQFYVARPFVARGFQQKLSRIFSEPIRKTCQQHSFENVVNRQRAPRLVTTCSGTSATTSAAAWPWWSGSLSLSSTECGPGRRRRGNRPADLITWVAD